MPRELDRLCRRMRGIAPSIARRVHGDLGDRLAEHGDGDSLNDLYNDFCDAADLIRPEFPERQQAISLLAEIDALCEEHGVEDLDAKPKAQPKARAKKAATKTLAAT